MANDRTSEANWEDGLGDGMGDGVIIGCGDGVKVEVREGETRVAVNCGDGVRVRVGKGSVVVCAGEGRLAEQPTKRLIPMVVISAMNARHELNLIQRGRLFLLSGEFGMETYPATVEKIHRAPIEKLGRSKAQTV